MIHFIEVHVNPGGSSAKKSHGQVEGPSVPPPSGSATAREAAIPFLDCTGGKGKQCQERFLQCHYEANKKWKQFEIGLTEVAFSKLL